MREISVDFPALGNPIEPDVGEQLQLEAEELLFPGPAGFGSPRRAVGGADEPRVSASAASAARDQDTLAFLGQVGEQMQVAVVGLLVHERADGHGDVEIGGGLSRPIRALAVLTAAGP